MLRLESTTFSPNRIENSQKEVVFVISNYPHEDDLRYFASHALLEDVVSEGQGKLPLSRLTVQQLLLLHIVQLTVQQLLLLLQLVVQQLLLLHIVQLTVQQLLRLLLNRPLRYCGTVQSPVQF